MEEHRQIQAIKCEFQLPESIIHRVQSFLTAKEAGRSAILSKSWCSAWSTRPNIDLDPHDLVGDDEDICEFGEFKEFARKTIQRYEQSNLKIQSFKISTYCPSDGDLVDDYDDFVNEMITRALKIGATHLTTQQNDRYPVVVLTHGVFEAENLIGLSVQGCKIDGLGLDRKVRCSKLESLSLNRLEINSAVISNIALCCPLIEKLSLCNLSSFTDDDDDDDCVFLSDLSSKFPSLKDLTLIGCKAQEVSSRTLERLDFAASRQPGLSVKFDVPSIRKFIFIGRDFFPLLSFVSVSREWVSDVSFSHYHLYQGITINTSWFRELNRFLTGLSLSKIRLSLNISDSKSFDYAVGDIQGLTKPEVENLAISVTALKDLSCYALFDGLFRICLPKVLTQYLCPKSSFSGNKIWGYLLCKTLVRGLDEKCMYGLRDLEEVNVQLFDEDVHAWRPLTLESLKEALTSTETCTSFLNALVSPKDEQEIRFQLKWKTQNAT